jgi:hypothetical protein
MSGASPSCSRLFREPILTLRGGAGAAIAALTKVKPEDGRAILRDTAANGPDGRRQVAAGVLVNFGEEAPLCRETTQEWLLVDPLHNPSILR